MSDFARSITNSIDTIFPNCKKLQCFLHLRRNVYRYLHTNKEEFKIKEFEEFKFCLLDDLDVLGDAVNSTMFAKATALFCDKYKKYTVFISYFKQYYLSDLCNWYLGASVPGIGNSNNPIEIFNAVINVFLKVSI